MNDSNIIRNENGQLKTPDTPIIPFIEGDGIGPDVWKSTSKVVNTAIKIAYNGDKKIIWKELLAGEKALKETGEYLPQETIKTLQSHLVGLKGPLGTPVGDGIRSLNVALRQTLKLFACVRPVQYFTNVPSPLKEPEKVDMVIFRENLEDVYCGIEFKYGEENTKQLIHFLKNEMNVHKIDDIKKTSIGIKPTSEKNSKQLIQSAIEYAIQHKRKSVTIVHKGNIMKFTEGCFLKWGYEVAEDEFGATLVNNGPNRVIKTNHGDIIIKNVIADNFLQQILLNPEHFDVIASMNLNGDYISDALAAQVGGIGISPGANINYKTGHAIFEATHGTAPDIANQNKANPCSLLLSSKMLLDYIGWTEAASLILKAVSKTLEDGCVTGDFANIIGTQSLSTDEFTQAIIERM